MLLEIPGANLERTIQPAMIMTNITNIHQNKKRGLKPSAGYEIPFSALKQIFLLCSISAHQLHIS
jgi:hypothetical protein